MYTIGLTGGIGSGKSTVAKLFSDLGVPVFDTDAIARQIVEPGQAALEEIKTTFDDTILTENGVLDRKKLRHLVFNDTAARNKLESILHPRIREALLTQINHCTASYCIAVIPLLIEKNWQSIVDRVLVVDIPEQLQLERASGRDRFSEASIREIMNQQVDRPTRLAMADDVIDNSGNPQRLPDQVNRLHKKYLQLSKNQ